MEVGHVRLRGLQPTCVVAPPRVPDVASAVVDENCHTVVRSSVPRRRGRRSKHSPDRPFARAALWCRPCQKRAALRDTRLSYNGKHRCWMHLGIGTPGDCAAREPGGHARSVANASGGTAVASRARRLPTRGCRQIRSLAARERSGAGGKGIAAFKILSPGGRGILGSSAVAVPSSFTGAAS
jgi:hypothetical protein